MAALQPLLFLGAAPYPEAARLIREADETRPRFKLAGILDDNPALHGTEIDGVPVLGPIDLARGRDDAAFVMGIAGHRNRKIRYEILRRLGLGAERFATFIHPRAEILGGASVGRGCLIHPGAVVFNQTVIEDHVIVLVNSVIGSRNRICEGALISSLVSTVSDVRIGHYAHIGTRTCVSEGVRIGPLAQVSLGSCVLRDVPAGVFRFGEPPRFLSRLEVPAALEKKWAAAAYDGGPNVSSKTRR